MIVSAKKLLTLGVIVVFVSTVSVYGLQAFTASVKQTVPITSVVNWEQFELKLEVAKADFAVGEPVEVRVSLTNIGNETATLKFSAKNDKVNFKVSPVNGTAVFHSVTARLMVTQDVSLEPNQTLSQIDVWMQNYYYNHTSQVPTGNYAIIGLTGRFFYKDIFPSMWIETSPVTITIK
jgi:hypothetical protein